VVERVGFDGVPPRATCIARFALLPDDRGESAAQQAMEDSVDKALFDKGLAVRREVLGAEYVDKSIAGATDFNRPLQEFVTEYCWGAVWTRPGLPRKTRSMLNLAMLTALNRPHEIKLHVKGALNNGISREEIAEIFLQAGVYCGVPAAVDAFRTAKEVFDEIDKQKA
jgi:4-carboxymuconolactone decarboxylase